MSDGGYSYCNKILVDEENWMLLSGTLQSANSVPILMNVLMSEVSDENNYRWKKVKLSIIVVEICCEDIQQQVREWREWIDRSLEHVNCSNHFQWNCKTLSNMYFLRKKTELFNYFWIRSSSICMDVLSVNNRKVSLLEGIFIATSVYLLFVRGRARYSVP